MTPYTLAENEEYVDSVNKRLLLLFYKFSVP